jgi:predicted GIY-YIG superfamily endonuclease
VKEHEQGKVASTKGKNPKLIYYEAYLNKQDAIDREIYLKTGDGRKQIRKQLKNILE